MAFYCEGCPLKDECILAVLELVGAPLAGRIDINHYSECLVFKKCSGIADKQKRYACVYAEHEAEHKKWDSEDDA